MSKRKSRSRNGAGAGYEVGYGKPPLRSRFRPGQSGNPAGRRKGVRNLKTDVKRALAIPVKLKEGGRTRTRSTQEGALLVLREKALRGDARSLDRLLELALRCNNDDVDLGSALPLAADDQAILSAYVADKTAVATSPTTPESPDDAASKRGESSGKKDTK